MRPRQGLARPRQRHANTLKIVAIGDSFTYGQGVCDEQTLPAALETNLKGRDASEFEVLNFGIPGLNLDEAIEQYRDFARQW